MNLHLQKLSGRLQLCMYSLLSNYILCSLIEAKPNLPSIQHALSLNSLIRWQYEHIKGHIVDINDQYNEVFPSFDLLNPEFSPSHRIIDIFIVVLLFIYLASTVTNISSHVFNNLIIWLLNLQVLHLMYLLSQTLVSRTMSLPLFHTFIFITNQSLKYFIMLWTSQVLRLSYLPLDVVSIKPSTVIIFQRLLSSLIQSTLQERYLIWFLTHSKNIQQLFLTNFKYFSLTIRKTQLNSGSVLVNVNCLFTKL